MVSEIKWHIQFLSEIAAGSTNSTNQGYKVHPKTSVMVNGLYLYFSAQSALLHKSAFTHSHTLRIGDFSTKSQPAHQELIHTPVVQPLKAIWGSVSCPRTLWHVDQRSQDRTTDLLIGRWPALPAEPQPTLSILMLCMNGTLHSSVQVAGAIDNFRE